MHKVILIESTHLLVSVDSHIVLEWCRFLQDSWVPSYFKTGFHSVFTASNMSWWIWNGAGNKRWLWLRFSPPCSGAHVELYMSVRWTVYCAWSVWLPVHCLKKDFIFQWTGQHVLQPTEETQNIKYGTWYYSRKYTAETGSIFHVLIGHWMQTKMSVFVGVYKFLEVNWFFYLHVTFLYIIWTG